MTTVNIFKLCGFNINLWTLCFVSYKKYPDPLKMFCTVYIIITHSGKYTFHWQFTMKRICEITPPLKTMNIYKFGKKLQWKDSDKINICLYIIAKWNNLRIFATYRIIPFAHVLFQDVAKWIHFRFIQCLDEAQQQYLLNANNRMCVMTL